MRILHRNSPFLTCSPIDTIEPGQRDHTHPGGVIMGTSTPTQKLCNLCGRPIAPARLEALPGVTTCIDCAKKHPRKVDVSGIELSQASPINRNGFAPKD
jgi:hypothetical protein